MPHVITDPVQIPVPGGKVINEHVGQASTHTAEVSIAHMLAPAGWEEPYQTPEFDEITIVVRGAVIVDCDGQRYEAKAGQSIVTKAGSECSTAPVRSVPSTSRCACRPSPRDRTSRGLTA